MSVPVGLEDRLVGEWIQAALGTESRFSSSGKIDLRVYFEDVADAASQLPAAARLLRDLGLDSGACDLKASSLADGRWAERWQEGLRAFSLGERFAVHPAGRIEEGLDDRLPILLVPGRAFGTGEHATTRLAAVALERHVRPGSRWLDLGTGTGLLALLAVRLGAGTVVARDNDPEAVEVARETLQANGAGDAVRLALGSTEGLPLAGFDGVAANIVAPFFLEHADAVAGLLAGGGVLLATGLLAEESGAVAARLVRAGLEVEGEQEDGPWRLLLARRPG